jgi:hypothetical protein
MAISETDIANAALIEIGAPMITNLTEDSEPARLINARFEGLLDEELEKADWTFATARVQLAALSEAPAFGWTYQHQLPSSPYCLRVIEEINDYEYLIEGRLILSDDTPLQIRYIKRITDMNELSGLFRSVLIYRLAEFLAIPLRGSGELRDRMQREYLIAFTRATSKDSQQSNYNPIEQGSWLDAKDYE